MSALRWYRGEIGYDTDRWILADADADEDWVRDRGLVELHPRSDGWSASAYLCARGPETDSEVVCGEALRVLKKQLRELLTRLETEEVLS